MIDGGRFLEFLLLNQRLCLKERRLEAPDGRGKQALKLLRLGDCGSEFLCLKQGERLEVIGLIGLRVFRCDELVRHGGRLLVTLGTHLGAQRVE